MLVVLKLLGSIALLIYGMKVMSEALQKMAGPQLRHLLGAMTTNGSRTVIGCNHRNDGVIRKRGTSYT